MDIIKKWFDNFDFNIDDFKINYNKNDIILKTNFNEENKDKYIISSTLKEDYEYYLKYFWDIDKIKDLNKNIITEIMLINRGLNSQIIYSEIDLKTKNVNIGKIKRQDELFLEKYDSGFIIYGKIIPEHFNNNSIYNINYSYTKINVYSVNNKTKIDIIMEINSTSPNILKMIPGTLIVKNLLNIKSMDDIEG